MGAGKTTVGKILAKKLRCRFFDTDAMIEKELGSSISQIFLNRGESFFRNVESIVVRKVSKNKGAVLALGGGVILRQDNWDVVNNSGISIYLKWDIKILLPRILGDKTRPLVKNFNNTTARTEIDKMFFQREPFYKRADFIVECGNNLEPSHIADRIIFTLQEDR